MKLSEISKQYGDSAEKIKQYIKSNKDSLSKTEKNNLMNVIREMKEAQKTCCNYYKKACK